MKFYKLLILIGVLTTACKSESENMVITSNDGKMRLTVVSNGKNHTLYSHSENMNYSNKSDFLKSDGFYEHYNALVKWKNDTTYLYFNYGNFDLSLNSKIKVETITVKEFERLKKLNDYTYFFF